MNSNEIQKKLADFFPATSIGWRPGATNKEKTSAVAFPYIDARDVMGRLDEVVGTENWRDEYSVTSTGQVLCKLSVRFGDEWITKMDIGGQSDQDDVGDKMKSAVSDAMKRAAVKFGIGRYLYSVPDQWIDIELGANGKFRRFKIDPKMPARFLHNEDKTKSERAADARPADATPADAKPPTSAAPDKDVPRTGKALVERLGKADKSLKGILAFVANCGSLWGYPLDMGKWTGPQLQEAVSFGKEFKRRLDEKVEMIREEQDAVIRGHVPEGDLTNLFTACKAAQVYAPDHMTAEEAKRVIGILESGQP